MILCMYKLENKMKGIFFRLWLMKLSLPIDLNNSYCYNMKNFLWLAYLMM